VELVACAGAAAQAHAFEPVMGLEGAQSASNRDLKRLNVLVTPQLARRSFRLSS
jgi:hypothetical protein